MISFDSTCNGRNGNLNLSVLFKLLQIFNVITQKKTVLSSLGPPEKPICLSLKWSQRIYSEETFSGDLAPGFVAPLPEVYTNKGLTEYPEPDIGFFARGFGDGRIFGPIMYLQDCSCNGNLNFSVLLPKDLLIYHTHIKMKYKHKI